MLRVNDSTTIPDTRTGQCLFPGLFIKKDPDRMFRRVDRSGEGPLVLPMSSVREPLAHISDSGRLQNHF